MQYNQQICVWKIILQKFNIKNDKPNSNINISKISHLPFYMLYYLLESVVVRWKINHNRLVSWKYPWFRTVRLVRQNNDCVMCFCILWYKNAMH